MLRTKILICLGGWAAGVLVGGMAVVIPRNAGVSFPTFKFSSGNIFGTSKQVIGFLPYWLLDKAAPDYSQYITTLTYFSLTLNGDGTVKKFNNPGESEPGWYALNSGKATPFLEAAKNKNLNLSLLVFMGNGEDIATLISDPVAHAQNLLIDVTGIMQQGGFNDLNLDIENIPAASDEARMKFEQFVASVKKGLGNDKTLTVEVTGNDVVQTKLINVAEVGRIADRIVIMAYDYHYPGSAVTGPVAPVAGAGSESEFDVQTAVAEASRIVPAEKIILGIPVYGYEWETIKSVPRSAVIPGTGVTASSQRVESLLKTCNDCQVNSDPVAQENYLIFKDGATGTIHQIFYPDKAATQGKVNLAAKSQIGGMALWALGYEGDDVLGPLAAYKR